MKEKFKKVKICLLIIFVGFGLIALTFSNKFTETASAFSAGPPPEHTGAPGEQTCAVCHVGGSGSGQFIITAPANYTPGQTYQIQVSHTTTDTTRRRWGFELTSLASNSAAGSFTDLNANTQTVFISERYYVGHTGIGTFQNQAGGAVWTFNWTAPATNVGAVTFYAAGNQANNNGNSNGDQIYNTTTISQPAIAVSTHRRSDFDGDGKSDIAVLRAQSGNAVWYAQTANTVLIQQFGLGTDTFVPADYDGDGKTDFAVFRAGVWWTFNSSTNTATVQTFGTSGDVPVIGDFDGDGKGDLAVFRAGLWWIRRSSNGAVTAQQWGQTGDKPLSGDFDGDGKTDLAIRRTAANSWFVLPSSGATVISVNFGLAGDLPVVGDYDGDGKDNIAVWRGSEGIFYTSTNVNNNYYGSVRWGIAGDIPVSADFDGDGKTDVAIYRNGVWWIRQSSNGATRIQNFGLSSDTAVPNLYF